MPSSRFASHSYALAPIPSEHASLSSSTAAPRAARGEPVRRWSWRRAVGLTVLIAALSPVAVGAQVTQLAFASGDSTNSVQSVRLTPLGNETLIAVGASPRAVAVTPDGQRLYVANYGGGQEISVHDAITGAALHSIPGTGASHGLAMSPDGTEVYASVTFNSTIAVIDTATDTVVASIPVGAFPSGIVFDAGGTRAYVSNEASQSVSVIDTTTRAEITRIPVGGSGTGLAITPDGEKGFVTLGYGTVSQRVQVLDLTNNTVSATIDITGHVPTGAALRPDGAFLFVAGRNTAVVLVIDTDTNQVVTTVPVPGGGLTRSVDVSRDGSHFYVVTESGALVVYDAETFSQVGSPLTLNASGSSASGGFLGPNYLTGTLPAGSDAEFDTYWAAPYVNLHGGTLQLTTPWVSARTLSVLATGGTIDTNGSDATFASTIHGGVLTKTGLGLLTITSPSHTGGTVISGGGLLVGSGVTHLAPITAEGGTLHGSGTAGAITVNASGAIEPGANGSGLPGILSASSVTFNAGSSLIVDINGPTAGTGYDRLSISGTATVTSSAGLTMRLGYTPAAGTSFVILENVSGAFQGLPEGSTLAVSGQHFVVSYLGGDGNDMTLTANNPPTASAIGPQSLIENRVLGPLSLTIGDDLTVAASLTVTGVSSDHAVVQDADIVITGASSPRSVTITPVDGANGQATITLNVSDGIHTTPVQFLLTVTADDDPTTTAPGNQTTKRDTVLGPLSFTIGDDLTDVSLLTVSAASSNTAVIRSEDVVLSGTGASRQLTITPQSLATGQTTITLTVTDELSQTGQATFTVDVELDDLPTIVGQSTASTTRDTVLGPLAFTIGDDVAAASDLTFAAASSDTSVVRNEDLVVGGSGANRTLTITPALHASGTTTITISVFDGLQTATHPLAVTVTMDAAPTINGPSDQNLILGDPLPPPLPFTVDDDLIAAADLTTTATSSNQALVRDADLAISGTGQQRTLTFTPVAEATGTAIITLNVFDGVHTTPHAFTLTMTEDLPPTIDGPTDQREKRDIAIGPLAFTVGDDLLALSALDITATSSDQALVRDEDLTLGGSDGARTLTITPVAGAVGLATITLRVADERSAATHAFTVAFDEPVKTYYLAEGASGTFFDTDLLLANPQDAAVPVEIDFLTAGGGRVTLTRDLAPTSRTTIRVDAIDGLESAEFATVVKSTTGAPIVVERTMWWDATGYGAHTEKAGEEGPGLQWYFAEGAQSDFFRTYLLLANPGPDANVAHVTYLRDQEPALTVDYPLLPASRRTIDAAEEPALSGRVFGSVVTFDRPGLAERAMYFGSRPLFSGGHASAGAAAPSRHWLLAEGATGSFFSTYVLLANPGSEPATATVTFLPDTGVPVTRAIPIGGFQRVTLDVSQQDPTLSAASVATQIDSDLPIIVERSVYWPNPGWYEAHNSGGMTAPARRWGLAEGRVGGPASDQTFVLLANPGTQPATVTLTFLREDSTTVTMSRTVAGMSRSTVSIAGLGSDVPDLTDESFGVIIASTEPIVVERSLYRSTTGLLWSAGTNATGTRLP